jgi:hypothetical protein
MRTSTALFTQLCRVLLRQTSQNSSSRTFMSKDKKRGEPGRCAPVRLGG